MEAYSDDENRWANSVGHSIIEEINKKSFNVEAIIQECEGYAKDKNLTEYFRECMSHAAQFLKIAAKYEDVSVMELAQIAAYGTMYGNLYDK